jgi:hypothetical protein
MMMTDRILQGVRTVILTHRADKLGAKTSSYFKHRPTTSINSTSSSHKYK